MQQPTTIRWRLAQFLEFRWWQRYLSDRSPEDYLERKQEYWARVLRELKLPVRPEERVLDAGCGPAGIFIHLHRTQHVTALDPLLSSYDRLPVFNRSDYPNVEFIEGRLEMAGGLPPFDTVYCFNAVNHVADWEKCLDVLTRLTKPGGRLILSSDVHRHGWLQPLFHTLPGDLLHPQQHTATAYTEALKKRGWEVECEVLMRSELIFNYRAWVCRRPLAPPPVWYGGGSVA